MLGNSMVKSLMVDQRRVPLG